MPDQIDLEKKKRPRIVYVIIALAVFGALFTVAGFTFAATQEQHDSFCASCHTQPEINLFRAVDCHAANRSGFLPYHSASDLY